VRLRTHRQEATAVKVTVDQEMCCGAGSCVLAAPEVFDQRDEDGIAFVVDADPPADQAGDVREAAAVCPALAILVTD
jgi:ferredoxin